MVFNSSFSLKTLKKHKKKRIHVKNRFSFSLRKIYYQRNEIKTPIKRCPLGKSFINA